MIYPGLVSITFRQFKPDKIIEIVKKAGLLGIEWGGDIHVPHGDLDTAEKVGKMTTQAGLNVPAYGSYYNLLESEDQGLTFQTVLDTADALGAAAIRIWAGKKEPSQADSDYFNKIVALSKEAAEKAYQKNIKLIYEFHDNTLNNTGTNSAKLIRAVDHPNLFTYWQPRHGFTVEQNLQDMTPIIDYIEGVHVFHWWPDINTRQPLQKGADRWQAYFEKISKTKKHIYALLEFVKDDQLENFINDSRTLKTLLSEFK